MKYVLKIGSVEKTIDDEAITFSKKEDSFSHKGLEVTSIITFQFVEKDYTEAREKMFKEIGDWCEINKLSTLTCSYYSDIIKKEISVWDKKIILVSVDIKTDEQQGLIFSVSVYGG